MCEVDAAMALCAVVLEEVAELSEELSSVRRERVRTGQSCYLVICEVFATHCVYRRVLSRHVSCGVVKVRWWDAGSAEVPLAHAGKCYQTSDVLNFFLRQPLSCSTRCARLTEGPSCHRSFAPSSAVRIVEPKCIRDTDRPQIPRIATRRTEGAMVGS